MRNACKARAIQGLLAVGSNRKKERKKGETVVKASGGESLYSRILYALEGQGEEKGYRQPGNDGRPACMATGGT